MRAWVVAEKGKGPRAAIEGAYLWPTRREALIEQGDIFDRVAVDVRLVPPTERKPITRKRRPTSKAKRPPSSSKPKTARGSAARAERERSGQ
jgi:hypothetical protein